MIRVIALGVALFLLVSGARANPAQDCNRNRDLDRTIRGCTEFIQQTRDSRQVVNTYYNRGNAYSAKNDRARAIADYSKAIEINPKHESRLQQPRQSILDQEVTQFDGGQGLRPLHLGVAYRDKKDDDRAIVEYTRAVELNTKEVEINVRVHLNRGVAHLTKRDYQRAIADMTKALTISRERADAYWQAGGVVSVKSDAYDARA